MARPQSRVQRKTAFIKAHMRDRDDWREVTIGNVSSTGLMVKTSPPPPKGSHVEIRRRSQVIVGEVVWTTQTRFGFRSFAPIDSEALTAQSGLDGNLVRSDEPARRGLWHWRG